MAADYDQSDTDSRHAICRALGNFRSAFPIAVPVLVRGLADTNEFVRMCAAEALGKLARCSEQAVPALTEAVDTDRDSGVRLLSLQSLSQFGLSATNALPAIRRACSDSDPEVRKMATNVLKYLSAIPGR